MHYLASLGAGFVLAVTALSMIVALNGSARYDVLKLERQKALLSDEIEEIQVRVAQMEGSIDVLIDKDEGFRLLAGLDVIDEEIFAVGVGGPGMLTPESSPLWVEDPAAAAVTFATSYDILALERRAQLLSESLSEAMDSLQAHDDLLRSTPSISPTDGPITSGFSYARMHPIYDRALPHEGIDLHAPMGTPILATAQGRGIIQGLEDRLRQHDRNRPRVWLHDPIRPRLEVLGGAGSSGRSRYGDCAGRPDRNRHGRARALRNLGRWKSHGPTGLHPERDDSLIP